MLKLSFLGKTQWRMASYTEDDNIDKKLMGMAKFILYNLCFKIKTSTRFPSFSVKLRCSDFRSSDQISIRRCVESLYPFHSQKFTEKQFLLIPSRGKQTSRILSAAYFCSRSLCYRKKISVLLLFSH